MKTIIFDLDNTLIECGVYYRRATEAVVLYLTTQSRLPEYLVREMVNHVDLAGTALQDGFQRARFPRACAAASYALDALQGLEPDRTRADHASAIADRVFDAPYETYPGVDEMLQRLRASGWQLAILTKGDAAVQQLKLHRFRGHVDHLRVVPKKTTAEWDSFRADIGATQDLTWAIGDSLRDDIAPAKAAGLHTVHVLNDSSAWGYESVDAVATLTVDRVTDIILGYYAFRSRSPETAGVTT